MRLGAIVHTIAQSVMIDPINGIINYKLILMEKEEIQFLCFLKEKS